MPTVHAHRAMPTVHAHRAFRLRLARATTGNERCVVVEHAYHGHTVGALGLSPYKFEHASFGGRGQPPWVAKCPAPDTYRGAHRGPAAAAAYARSVEEACAAGATPGRAAGVP